MYAAAIAHADVRKIEAEHDRRGDRVVHVFFGDDGYIAERADVLLQLLPLLEVAARRALELDPGARETTWLKAPQREGGSR